jgi:hypothetical protein
MLMSTRALSSKTQDIGVKFSIQVANENSEATGDDIPLTLGIIPNELDSSWEVRIVTKCDNVHQE